MTNVPVPLLVEGAGVVDEPVGAAVVEDPDAVGLVAVGVEGAGVLDRVAVSAMKRRASASIVAVAPESTCSVRPASRTRVLPVNEAVPPEAITVVPAPVWRRRSSQRCPMIVSVPAPPSVPLDWVKVPPVCGDVGASTFSVAPTRSIAAAEAGAGRERVGPAAEHDPAVGARCRRSRRARACPASPPSSVQRARGRGSTVPSLSNGTLTCNGAGAAAGEGAGVVDERWRRCCRRSRRCWPRRRWR